MTASLIVTTYKSPRPLQLCLESISRMHQLPREVIVADDGSGSTTADLVEHMAKHFPVPLIHVWQEDLGFRVARVRNLAASRASGDHLIFVDGDLILHPHFVRDHLRLWRRGTFLQGGRLNTSPKEAQRLLAGGSARFSALLPMARGLRGELKRKHAIRIPWLARLRSYSRHPGVTMGCNVSISKGDFIRVNGFDEEFEGWGQEDDDIAWRLQRLGVRQARLRYAGLALHLWHPSRQTEAGEGQSNLRLLNSRRAAGRVWCQRGLAGHQVFRRHVRPAGAVELTSRLQRYRAP